MTSYTTGVFSSTPDGSICRHPDLSASQGVDIAKTSLGSLGTMANLQYQMEGYSQREMGKDSDMIILETNGSVNFTWCFYRSFANQKALSMWVPREETIGGVVKVRWVNRSTATTATTENMLESVGYPVQGLIPDDFALGANMQALNTALSDNLIFASCWRA